MERLSNQLSFGIQNSRFYIMNILVFLLILIHMNTNGRPGKPQATVEKVSVGYQGRIVKANKLTVRSEINITLDQAWEYVQSPRLLEYVAKGIIRFKPLDDRFPDRWQEGQTYRARMRIFGFIPLGGPHHFFIQDIDHESRMISSKEWDKAAKIWNHEVRMESIDETTILYEDSIVIFGGIKTGFITAFAKLFYKHRQKRWRRLAEEKPSFDGHSF